MAQGTGAIATCCDCSVVFRNEKLLNNHLVQAGHMEDRWCATCCRLFLKKERLKQHTKDSTRHHSSEKQIAISVSGIPRSKLPKPRPNPTSNQGAAAARRSKATGGRKQNKPQKQFNTTPGMGSVTIYETIRPCASSNNPFEGMLANSQSMQTFQQQVSKSHQPIVATSSKPSTSSYPWVSMKVDYSLSDTLAAHCHVESCLEKQGFYVGGIAAKSTHGTGSRHRVRGFLPTPRGVNGTTKRVAIALDCEMVGIAGGRSELAYICAVDFFTGEILINSFVAPTEPVRDWRTRFSGIKKATMAEARASGKVLEGWPAARQKLFEIANVDTVLVGHSLENDLRVLHISHRRVLDSSILTAEAVFGKDARLLRRWSLKQLSQDILGINIQISCEGHDCLEDVFATRELTLRCLTQREEIEDWAKKAQHQFEIDRRRREERE